MCGRYESGFGEPDTFLEALLKDSGEDVRLLLTKREVCPGEIAAVVVSDGRKAYLTGMRWGFDGPRGLVINARSETAAERSMFAGCVKAYRCLIPASSYFEWHQVTGAKYRVAPPDGKTFWMAGLYLPLPDAPARYVVITRAASAELSALHPRMPLVLATQKERFAWLNSPQAALELLRHAGISALQMRLAAPEQLSMFDRL